MADPDIQTAIRHALRYIAASQAADGGFVSWSSPKRRPAEPAVTYRTGFVPAQILAALSSCHDPTAQTIRAKAARFLLTQRSQFWSFNYWDRASLAATRLPYPDDLDDTFCALSALWLHDQSLLDASALAGMTKVLLATESQPGGPYKTWLVSKNAPARWHDIDIVANANVAYFLSLAANPLPQLTTYMTQAIDQGALISAYYPGKLPVMYFLARACQDEPAKKQLAQHILKLRSRGHLQTPHKTAMAVTALLHLGRSDVKAAIGYLLSAQRPDGSWPAEAFCLDPKRDGKVYYCSAPALTTALVVEALLRYGQIKQSQAQAIISESSLLQKQLLHAAQKELQPLNPLLRKQTLLELRNQTSGRNGQEIMLLPQTFYRSLRQSTPLADELFIDLSLANAYGWLAYTIYDDFLDDEGNPRRLSVANVVLRRSLQAFMRALPDNKQFQQVVLQTFDTIDAANHWELTQCRFAVTGDVIIIETLPRYGSLHRLADRSLGHALSPLAVLAAQGISLTSPAGRHVLLALKHYIIARQLNDDAHDWRSDLMAGRITAVVAQLLQELAVPVGKQQLSLLIPQAEKQFWHTTLPIICERIAYHGRLSRRALKQSRLLADNNPLLALLDRIDASVKETQATLKQTEVFVRAYQATDTPVASRLSNESSAAETQPEEG